MAAPLLEMKGIVKEYPGVRALDGVDLQLVAGEVHCLVGENGAGKSTLVKILSGAVLCDAGSILINGNPVVMLSPEDAIAERIGVVYQEPMLVPELSSAENIFLGFEQRRKGSFLIDHAELTRQARMLIAELFPPSAGSSFDVTIPVKQLSIAAQQIVEVAKALSRDVRVLVLDEPTASLTLQEIAILFSMIKRLQQKQVGIIYISHRMEEIFDIGDRVTILRDGRNVHTSAMSEISKERMISMMVGRTVTEEYPKRTMERREEILRMENITSGKIDNVSLTLRRGEVVGLAGLVGAGRTELARLIFGADQRESGKIILEGTEVRFSSPNEAIQAGIGLLTEDRNRFGLLVHMSVKENFSLSSLPDFVKNIFIDVQAEKKAAQYFVDTLSIKTPSIDTAVEALSGGNRQKVILSRWLHAGSKVLIFDEPTAGVDVGAKVEIYSLIDELAHNGTAVLIISSDMDELMGICDRILVLCEGKIAGELRREDATQEKILQLALSNGQS